MAKRKPHLRTDKRSVRRRKARELEKTLARVNALVKAEENFPESPDIIKSKERNNGVVSLSNKMLAKIAYREQLRNNLEDTITSGYTAEELRSYLRSRTNPLAGKTVEELQEIVNKKQTKRFKQTSSLTPTELEGFYRKVKSIDVSNIYDRKWLPLYYTPFFYPLNKKEAERDIGRMEKLAHAIQNPDEAEGLQEYNALLRRFARTNLNDMYKREIAEGKREEKPSLEQRRIDLANMVFKIQDAMKGGETISARDFTRYKKSNPFRAYQSLMNITNAIGNPVMGAFFDRIGNNKFAFAQWLYDNGFKWEEYYEEEDMNNGSQAIVDFMRKHHLPILGGYDTHNIMSEMMLEEGMVL